MRRQLTVNVCTPRNEPAGLTNSTAHTPTASAGTSNCTSPGVRETTVAEKPHTRTSLTISTWQLPVAVTTDPTAAVDGTS
jgi:hypothetical protein